MATASSEPSPRSGADAGDETTATKPFSFKKAPKLSIKLEDRNYLLWNQQVEGIIKTHRLHRFLLNPEVPPRFASETDRLNNVNSPEFDQWIVQDQTIFTWLLSTVSESVLPRVLSCEHAWQVWDKIHSHHQAHLKAKARKLKSELKSTKKGTRSVSEYVLRIQALENSLAASRVVISEAGLCDAVLDGLPEDYNSFVMTMYGRPEGCSLTELESLLLVQEAQLQKFKQELSVANVSANVAYSGSGSCHHTNGGKGRGRFGRGRGRNGARSGTGSVSTSQNTGKRPTCQLCGKYGHSVVECWHRFDEQFVPQEPQADTTTANTSTDSAKAEEEAVTAFLASAEGTGINFNNSALKLKSGKWILVLHTILLPSLKIFKIVVLILDLKRYM